MTRISLTLACVVVVVGLFAKGAVSQYNYPVPSIPFNYPNSNQPSGAYGTPNNEFDDRLSKEYRREQQNLNKYDQRLKDRENQVRREKEFEQNSKAKLEQAVQIKEKSSERTTSSGGTPTTPRGRTNVSERTSSAMNSTSTREVSMEEALNRGAGGAGASRTTTEERRVSNSNNIQDVLNRGNSRGRRVEEVEEITIIRPGDARPPGGAGAVETSRSSEKTFESSRTSGGSSGSGGSVSRSSGGSGSVSRSSGGSSNTSGSRSRTSSSETRSSASDLRESTANTNKDEVLIRAMNPLFASYSKGHHRKARQMRGYGNSDEDFTTRSKTSSSSFENTQGSQNQNVRLPNYGGIPDDDDFSSRRKASSSRFESSESGGSGFGSGFSSTTSTRRENFGGDLNRASSSSNFEELERSRSASSLRDRNNGDDGTVTIIRKITRYIEDPEDDFGRTSSSRRTSSSSFSDENGRGRTQVLGGGTFGESSRSTTVQRFGSDDYGSGRRTSGGDLGSASTERRYESSSSYKDGDRLGDDLSFGRGSSSNDNFDTSRTSTSRKSSSSSSSFEGSGESGSGRNDFFTRDRNRKLGSSFFDDSRESGFGSSAFASSGNARRFSEASDESDGGFSRRGYDNTDTVASGSSFDERRERPNFSSEDLRSRYSTLLEASPEQVARYTGSTYAASRYSDGQGGGSYEYSGESY